MVQEERVKDITQGKQAKDGGIKIAGVMVALYPSSISNVLEYLVWLNCLIIILPERDTAQS